MALIQVGVVRGGPTAEYDVSLRTGQHILNMLAKEPLASNYKGKDILIDQEGVWHMDGIPQTPDAILRGVDVVFNATKGNFEKGSPLQRILESFKVPFVGTETLGSALTKNKVLSKEHFKKQGIKTPYYKELNLPLGGDLNPVALDLFRTFPMPVIVKPVGKGSSLGVSFASNFEELIEALKHARGFSEEVLVEEYLTGKEIISGFIDDFRGKDLYHMFPVEIKPHEREDFLSTTLPNTLKSDAVNANMSTNPEVQGDALVSGAVKVDDLSESEKALIAPLNELATSSVTNVTNSPKKKRHSIFDWVGKHAGLYDHSSPANLTSKEKKTIEEAVAKIKETLGLRHFATADFIVHPKRGVYLLEINTDPSLHEHAPVYKALDAAGIKHHEFFDHLIRLALGGKK